MTADDKELEEQLRKEQEAGLAARLGTDPPPGMLPDGTLNVVSADDPPYRPKVEGEGDDDDLSDLDELDELV
jgi:hypothetical protein